MSAKGKRYINIGISAEAYEHLADLAWDRHVTVTECATKLLLLHASQYQAEPGTRSERRESKKSDFYVAVCDEVADQIDLDSGKNLHLLVRPKTEGHDENGK